MRAGNAESNLETALLQANSRKLWMIGSVQDVINYIAQHPQRAAKEKLIDTYVIRESTVFPGTMRAMQLSHVPFLCELLESSEPNLWRACLSFCGFIFASLILSSPLFLSFLLDYLLNKNKTNKTHTHTKPPNQTKKPQTKWTEFLTLSFYKSNINSFLENVGNTGDKHELGNNHFVTPGENRVHVLVYFLPPLPPGIRVAFTKWNQYHVWYFRTVLSSTTFYLMLCTSLVL